MGAPMPTQPQGQEFRKVTGTDNLILRMHMDDWGISSARLRQPKEGQKNCEALAITVKLGMVPLGFPAVLVDGQWIINEAFISDW